MCCNTTRALVTATTCVASEPTALPLAPLSAALHAAAAPLVRLARGVHADSFEVQYLRLLRTVLEQGTMQANRTGVRAITLPGASMRFDLTKGFPAVTTKKLAIKSVFGELCAFLRGSTSAADFRALGSKVWDQNANDNKDWLANPWRDGPDHLGPVYGAMWRAWPAFKDIALGPKHCSADVRFADDVRQQERLLDALQRGYRVVTDYVDDAGELHVVVRKNIDQLGDCLRTVVDNPTDRRIVFHGWNPATLEQQALPVCHAWYQLLPNVDKHELSMCLYLRSNDLGLGAPFNAAEAAAMLELFARLTGYTAKWLTIFIADAHIYENHLPMVREQLRRHPKRAPSLVIDDRVPAFTETGRLQLDWLEHVSPTDFTLVGYEHHAPLTAAMAV